MPDVKELKEELGRLNRYLAARYLELVPLKRRVAEIHEIFKAMKAREASEHLTSCGGKRCYASDAHARAVRRGLSDRLRTYKCDRCGAWHLTKNAE